MAAPPAVATGCVTRVAVEIDDPRAAVGTICAESKRAHARTVRGANPPLRAGRPFRGGTAFAKAVANRGGLMNVRDKVVLSGLVLAIGFFVVVFSTG